MFHVPGFIDARIQSSQEPIKFDGLLVQPLIEKGMRCRDAAIRKAIQTKNPQYWGNYRKLRNRINNKVKTTKASYYHKNFIQSKGNARRTGKTINNLMSRRQSNEIVKDVKVNDISICVSNEISNAFITYAGSDLHLIKPSLSHDLEKLSKWLVSNRLTFRTLQKLNLC